MAAFDGIKINDVDSGVKAAIGAPTEVRHPKDAPNLETWIYDDSDESQRAAINIDSASHKVTGITIIPRESEPEFQLSYLLRAKYAGLSFTSVPKQVCGRDYIPPEVFQIDTKTGVVIQANENTGAVESFGKLSPSAAAALIEKIKSCRR